MLVELRDELVASGIVVGELAGEDVLGRQGCLPISEAGEDRREGNEAVPFVEARRDDLFFLDRDADHVGEEGVIADAVATAVDGDEAGLAAEF